MEGGGHGGGLGGGHIGDFHGMHIRSVEANFTWAITLMRIRMSSGLRHEIHSGLRHGDEFCSGGILTVGRTAADISGNRRSIATDAATNGNGLLVSGCNRFVRR